MMYIKEIIEYSYSYAAYIVSDGTHELNCMCLSVPLPNGREPRCGLEITNIFAFCVDHIVINKIADKQQMKDSISKAKKSFFGYKLKGRIIDVECSIVEIFNFKISLAYDFPHGLGKEYRKGEYIEFMTDRLDCAIENIYYY